MTKDLMEQTQRLTIDIVKKAIDHAYEALSEYRQPNKQLTGLISKKALCEELDIGDRTIKKWEDAGLRRYQPPLDESKKAFYKIVDVLAFLGVDDV